MGKFNISLAKLTGNPDESGWAQVHDFTPEEPQKLKLRGRLIAVIATSKQKQGVDSVVAGRELITRLHEEYFGTTQKTTFNALTDAVEKVIREFSENWGDVEIAAASVVDGIIYSTCGGGGEAAVFRNGMLAKILVSKENGPVTASGRPQENDVFLLGTKKTFDLLSEGVIKAALEKGEIEKAIESLAPSIHSAKGAGNLGLVLIRFSSTPVFFRKEEKREDIKKRAVVSKPKIFSRLSKVTSPPKIIKSFERLLERKAGRKKIYIRRRGEDEFDIQKRKMSVSVGAILVILLLVSIVFGIKQKIARDKKARYEDRLTQAQHEFEEAQSLYSLNPERARELFRNAKRLTYQMQEEGVKDPGLENLAGLLKESEGQILGEYTVEPDLFLDLSILTNGFSADDVAASEGKLYVLDKKGSKIVKIEIDTKKTQVVAGPDQVKGAEELAAYTDKVYVLLTDGVYDVTDGKELAIEKDWQGKVLIYAYAGNFYILEKQTSKVWRYPGVEGGFASRQAWLAPGVEPDLGSIFSWTIDGSIWFLSETGKVFKFTRGNQDSLTFAGIEPALTYPSAIYTNENLKFTYLLEKESGRVVVIDKEGNYKAQYFSDKIREAKGLVVSEEAGKIILVTSDKLYSIDITHKLE